MAKTITFVFQRLRQEEVLSVPQGPWSLHRKLLGPEGADIEIDTERKAIKVCEEGRISRFRDDDKSQCQFSPKDEDHTSQQP